MKHMNYKPRKRMVTEAADRNLYKKDTYEIKSKIRNLFSNNDEIEMEPKQKYQRVVSNCCITEPDEKQPTLKEILRIHKRFNNDREIRRS